MPYSSASDITLIKQSKAILNKSCCNTYSNNGVQINNGPTFNGPSNSIAFTTDTSNLSGSSNFTVNNGPITIDGKQYPGFVVGISGDLHVSGEIDPTGIEFTPVTSNPGASRSATTTLWASAPGVLRFGDLYIGASGEQTNLPTSNIPSDYIYNTGNTWAAGSGSGTTTAIHIGPNAGYDGTTFSQSSAGIAIGASSATTSQGINAIAIGVNAGQSNQGDYSIAIGNKAGVTGQVQKSIILNASDSDLNATTNSGLYVNPIRSQTYTDGSANNITVYNSNTKEVTSINGLTTNKIATQIGTISSTPGSSGAAQITLKDICGNNINGIVNLGLSYLPANTSVQLTDNSGSIVSYSNSNTASLISYTNIIPAKGASGKNDVSGFSLGTENIWWTKLFAHNIVLSTNTIEYVHPESGVTASQSIDPVTLQTIFQNDSMQRASVTTSAGIASQIDSNLLPFTGLSFSGSITNTSYIYTADDLNGQILSMVYTLIINPITSVYPIPNEPTTRTTDSLFNYLGGVYFTIELPDNVPTINITNPNLQALTSIQGNEIPNRNTVANVTSTFTQTSSTSLTLQNSDILVLVPSYIQNTPSTNNWIIQLTWNKVAFTVPIDGISTQNIKNGSLTLPKLAANSVDATKIVAKTITAAQIANNTINTGQLASGAIDNNILADNSVSTNKILNSAITLDKLDISLQNSIINPGGTDTTKLGNGAGSNGQGTNSIAIGVNAGNNNQQAQSIAIGLNAGLSGQGTNSIAIGSNAAPLNQSNNTIVINASNTTVNTVPGINDALYVKPIRNDVTTNLILGYNTTTNEITYRTGLSDTGVEVVPGFTSQLLESLLNRIDVLEQYIFAHQSTYDIVDSNGLLLKIKKAIDNSTILSRESLN